MSTGAPRRKPKPADFTVEKAETIKATTANVKKASYAPSNGLSQRERFLAAERRRIRFTEMLSNGATVRQACDELGCHINTYYKWRGDFPMFAARCDAARVGFYHRTKLEPGFKVPRSPGASLLAAPEPPPDDTPLEERVDERDPGLRMAESLGRYKREVRAKTKAKAKARIDAVGIDDRTESEKHFDEAEAAPSGLITALAEAFALHRQTHPDGDTDDYFPELMRGGTPGARFAMERARWFDNVSPPFQLEIIDAFENLKPGNSIIVLLPPEHGKTTLFEDWASLKLAQDPDHRFHVASESVSLSRKILGRVMHRMQSDTTPYPEWVATHGPFSPAPGRRQVWTADYFNVYHKGAQDERDYSMTALGFGSQIIGSRSDHLHGDDLQSLRSLGATEKYVETIRQDWLSRTGETGVNSFMGNRIGEGDVWEGLIEAFDEDLCQVIRYPPIIMNLDGTPRPLWEGRWTLEQLDRMRRKVGDIVWERNWMQRPRVKGTTTFDADQVDGCLNPLMMLSASRHERGGDAMPQYVYVGLDPAIGSRNAMVAVAPTSDSLTVVGIQEDTGFVNNEQIMAALERFLIHLIARGFTVTDVIVEAKNFQAGLARDERLLAMRDTYGFALREHLTGINKYDENIGVPSMAHTLSKRQLVLPWAADEHTQFMVGALRAQFFAWRPLARGTRLRQDLLMALWFCWILWRSRRGATQSVTSSFDSRAMPYRPTRAGLIMPVGAWR